MDFVDQIFSGFASVINHFGATTACDTANAVGRHATWLVGKCSWLLNDGIQKALPEGPSQGYAALVKNVSDATDHVFDCVESWANEELVHRQSGFSASTLIWPTLFFAAAATATWHLSTAARKDLHKLLTGTRTDVQIKHYDVTPLDDPTKKERLHYTIITDSCAYSVAIGFLIAPAASIVTGYVTFLFGKGIYHELNGAGADLTGCARVLLAGAGGLIALQYAACAIQHAAQEVWKGFSGTTGKSEPVYPQIFHQTYYPAGPW